MKDDFLVKQQGKQNVIKTKIFFLQKPVSSQFYMQQYILNQKIEQRYIRA